MVFCLSFVYRTCKQKFQKKNDNNTFGTLDIGIWQEKIVG